MSTPQASTGGRKRSVARLAAVQALYQVDLSGVRPSSVIAEFIKHRFGHELDGDDYGEADIALFSDIVEGTVAHQAELDRSISAALMPEWPLERLETVLRAILRAGAWELTTRIDVPARVAINEYLDVAHAFFNGKEPGLVNGVLDRLAQTLRPNELRDGSRGGDAAPR